MKSPFEDEEEERIFIKAPPELRTPVKIQVSGTSKGKFITGPLGVEELEEVEPEIKEEPEEEPEVEPEVEIVEEDPEEVIEEPEEPEIEIVEEEEVVEPDLKLEFDPIIEDQVFTGDVFVAPVPLLHLEYNFQLGDTFTVESKNPKNSEIIFVGAKTNFSLFDPSNFEMFNVGDIYKVVNRNVDVKGRPYDYNITFERTRRK